MSDFAVEVCCWAVLGLAVVCIISGEIVLSRSARRPQRGARENGQ